MDFGKTLRGRRVLGDGKTWRGFIGGASAGILLGLLQIALTRSLELGEEWSHGELSSAFVIVLCLGLGSMMGDSIGSFIKRRLGVNRGTKAPGLDQYNFLLGAILLVIIFQFGWFDSHFIEGNAIWALVALLVVVPLLHRGVNIIGYKMGKKNVPW